MSTKKTVERNWLYEEVWKRPMTKIAADVGITNIELKKVCDAMDIPTPASGHWMKVEFGKAVTKPGLTAPRKETKTSWEIGSTAKKPSKPKKDTSGKLQVPEETPVEREGLGAPGELHPLAKSTCAQLREDKKNLDWHNRKNRRRLNCQISESVIERVGRILDAFVRGCEAAGYIFRSELDGKKSPKRSRHTDWHDRREEPSGICWIEADGEKIRFFLRERNKRIYLPEDEQSWWKKYDEVPSGMLECQIGDEYGYRGRTNWRDGKVQKVEALIPIMIAELPLIAKAKKVERDRDARRERRWQYERELRNFEQQRIGLQQEALKKFFSHSCAHQSANLARRYLEAVKAQLYSEHDSDEDKDTMEAWIKWAEQAIRAIDPVQGSSPPWKHSSFVEVLENRNLEPPKPPDDFQDEL